MAEDKINFFDNTVTLEARANIHYSASNSNFVLGWHDFASGEHTTEANLYSEWSHDYLAKTKILQFIQPCIAKTDWFTNNVLNKAVVNLVKSDDVHHIHAHEGDQVALYYINIDWQNSWYGETLFYDSFNFNKIIYASPFVPGRILLFDGKIPHAIRPQSKAGPKFRMTLSLFYSK
jgi:hypothetical protein